MSLPKRWLQVLAALARQRTHPQDLAQRIYEQQFARWSPPPDSRANDPAFVEQVALATQTATHWESGWELIQKSGDWRFVHSGLLQLFVGKGELWPARARLGQAVQVRMPCLREGLMPGFLYAFARAGGIDPAAPHLRIYLNLDATAAARLFERLLTAKPFEPLRFETKIPSTRDGFGRCDSMVVYVEPGDALELLRRVRREKRNAPKGWRAPTPFAALVVEPGIALAESPPLQNGEALSFGQHRSALLARSVLESRAARERTPAEWADRLAEILASEGLDPHAPHRHRLPEAVWKPLLRPIG